MTRCLPAVAVLLAVGCEPEPTLILPNPSAAHPSPAPSAFDATRCGTITGRVTWVGPAPEVPTFLYGVSTGGGNFATRTTTGPNQPRIAADSKAVAGGVVFLRGVDPATARPWDNPPVRVEIADRAIRVCQGDRAPDRVGFVKCGDAVEFVSRDPVFHIVRGRGASFFSVAFPEPGQARSRTFTEPGRVILSSGAGYYWASADLFIADHPYFTVTDSDGRFVLPLVPAGRVEVVVWHPGWLPARQDRDPETGLVSRMTYSPPLERVIPAAVAAGATNDVAATLP